MSRGAWTWAGLLVAGLAGAGLLVAQATSAPSRPVATGDVGVLKVYAQLPSGPVRLPPGRHVRLPRPQDFAFYLEVEGTGPRFVRIEVEAAGTRSVMFEERVEAPRHEYLGYTLRLGEGVPDDVMLTVVVEAPHMMSAVSDFPLRLAGGETRFWEPGPDPEPAVAP
jgi:hypothetical protein